MEKPAFTRMSLSDVKLIMISMRVLVEEFLCQAVMEQIPLLKGLLSGARGHLWLRLVLPGIKYHRYPRTPALCPLAWYLGYPQAWLPRARGTCRASARG
jgi:hypothetical protein